MTWLGAGLRGGWGLDASPLLRGMADGGCGVPHPGTRVKGRGYQDHSTGQGQGQAALRRGDACGLAGVREGQMDMGRVCGLEARQLQSWGASAAAERCGVTRQNLCHRAELQMVTGQEAAAVWIAARPGARGQDQGQRGTRLSHFLARAAVTECPGWGPDALSTS